MSLHTFMHTCDMCMCMHMCVKHLRIGRVEAKARKCVQPQRIDRLLHTVRRTWAPPRPPRRVGWPPARPAWRGWQRSRSLLGPLHVPPQCIARSAVLLAASESYRLHRVAKGLHVQLVVVGHLLVLVVHLRSVPLRSPFRSADARRQSQRGREHYERGC